VERGSFVAGEDLGPFWEMGWPGLDELMALLEIQRILRDREADRVVVDMAPSGHTLTLFALMDFLDTLLESLDQFQEKHRYMTQTLSGQYQPDEADSFIEDMRHDLKAGRSLIQDPERTACWVVGIPEPMSWAGEPALYRLPGAATDSPGGAGHQPGHPAKTTFSTRCRPGAGSVSAPGGGASGAVGAAARGRTRGRRGPGCHLRPHGPHRASDLEPPRPAAAFTVGQIPHSPRL
jgi:hypothetical protein